MAGFLILATGLYFLWYLVYDLWLHPKGVLDNFVIDNATSLTVLVLEFLGYEVFRDGRLMGITGTSGIWIGDPCNGLTLFALFAGFVIAFPGRLVNKLLYIPVGIMLIHLMNVVRISALVIILKYSPASLDFNHTYTFTFIMYLLIFSFWVLWVKKIRNWKLKAATSIQA